MKRFFQSEAGALVCWVVSSIFFAAVISPWVYQAGKAIAEMAEVADLNGFLEWLGASCERARFGRYFSRSLILAAVGLLPVLFWRLNRIRRQSGMTSEQTCHYSARNALLQLGFGCAIAGSFLLATGMIAATLGAYLPLEAPAELGAVMLKILMLATLVSLLEEWLFRGLLLGLWLKLAKPRVACMGTSLVFAWVHFLEPSSATVLTGSSSTLAGFKLVGEILQQFGHLRFLITDFMPLFFIGLILAWARVRTGSLWLAIGLHAGWILALKGFTLTHLEVVNHPLHPWILGSSLRSGLLPLAALVVTAGACHLALRGLERAGLWVSHASR
ncbi:MAG: CPBP family intramembrane metalloprotease [Akkermansiaceae bacterium]|nr:CPBP family intramembrane metalloprotease [Akkermansiaceae bacterium]